MPGVHQHDQSFVAGVSQFRSRGGRGDRTVDSDGVPIAARDWGGEGRDVVLLHGAGMDQTSMGRLAGRLRRTCRVVSYDSRGHGASGAGRWDFETALADLDAVIDHFGLSGPGLVGHSLGGMVALLHAQRRATGAGAVNIDGWGFGRAEDCVGLDPDRTRVLHHRMQRLQPTTLLGRVVLPVLGAASSLRGRRSTLRQVQDAVNQLDVVQLLGSVCDPTLSFLCVASTSYPVKMFFGTAGVRLLDAYRTGLRGRLDELGAEPGRTIVALPCTHLSVLRSPELLTPHIERLFAVRHAAG